MESEIQGAESGQLTVLTLSSVKFLLCLLVEVFILLELRPLDQQSIKSQRPEAKNWAGGPLGVTVNDVTPISTP